MERFPEIPIFGGIMTMIMSGMQKLADVFVWFIETPLTSLVDSIGGGEGFIHDLLKPIFDLIINTFFTAFNIPSDVTIASFLLFFGIQLIFIIWIFNFFVNLTN